MPRWDSVAIIGVGLIGGSIGLAMKERRLAGRIVGVGRRMESLQRARAAGCVDEVTTDLAQGVAQAELIVVCTPVGRVAADVVACAEACPSGALITDAGSSKATIIRDVGETLPRGVRFVGSHPLAGSEKTGPEHARARLFEGRLVVVTPTATTPAAALEATLALWRELGARVMTLDPDAHDAAVAATSHVPHLVAAALAAATPEELLPLVATGWLDTTRVAGGDAQLWTEIFRSNGPYVLAALSKVEALLDRYRAAIADGRDTEVAELLAQGKTRRDAAGGNNHAQGNR